MSIATIYLERDPFLQFEKWFQEASSKGLAEVNAMTLATVDADNKPRARTLLLKGVEDNKFIFYTNYNSNKAKELDQNPFASLCFYWPMPLGYQVRIEGRVAKTSPEVSKAYFATRPRESQLAAWASDQSSEIKDKDSLIRSLEKIRDKFEGKKVVCPPHWGGYELTPETFDFMVLDRYRLHDRFAYRKIGQIWHKQRLNP